MRGRGEGACGAQGVEVAAQELDREGAIAQALVAQPRAGLGGFEREGAGGELL
jgi:hypothetical protein